MGTQPHTFVYILSRIAFTLQWQVGVVLLEIVWPANPKILTWFFTDEIRLTSSLKAVKYKSADAQRLAQVSLVGIFRLATNSHAVALLICGFAFHGFG